MGATAQFFAWRRPPVNDALEAPIMVKVMAWNIARRDEAWRYLLDTDADIALLQEAAAPPADVARRLEVDPSPWRTAGAGVNRPWRAAVVKLSSRVQVQWIEPKPLADALPGDLAVSRLGTLAAAMVTPGDDDPFVAASMYAPWEKPHATTGSGWIYADGSVHRLISDLSALVGQQVGHRILAAGDLNILYGYGEHGSPYWALPVRVRLREDGGNRFALRGSAGPGRSPFRPVAR
jgi:hypothetical protein